MGRQGDDDDHDKETYIYCLAVVRIGGWVGRQRGDGGDDEETYSYGTTPYARPCSLLHAIAVGWCGVPNIVTLFITSPVAISMVRINPAPISCQTTSW